MTSWKLSSSGAYHRGVTWPSPTICVALYCSSFLSTYVSNFDIRGIIARCVSSFLDPRRPRKNYAILRHRCFSFQKESSWREETLLDLLIFLVLPYFLRKHRDPTSFRRDFGREAAYTLLWGTLVDSVFRARNWWRSSTLRRFPFLQFD